MSGILGQKKYRVAFVGSGLMARAHAKAFNDIDEVELVGVFSRTLEKSTAFAKENGINLVCSSIEDLFSRAKPDIVVMAVNELSLHDLCIKAFTFPWVILIEKPIGINLNEAENLLALSIKFNAKAYVALNRRHYSSTRAVLKEINDGPRLVQVFDQEDPVAGLIEGKPRVVVENWRYANSIHVVDYFSIFCRGNLSSIENLTSWSDQDAAYCLARLNFSSGDVGIYQAIWNAPGPWAVSVTTAKMRWEMRPLEMASRQIYNSRKIEPLIVDNFDIEFKPGIRFQAEETLNVLRGLPNQLPTIAEGVKTMRIIRDIYGA